MPRSAHAKLCVALASLLVSGTPVWACAWWDCHPGYGSRKQVRVYGYSSPGARSGVSGRITTRPGVWGAPPNINANSGLQGPGYLSYAGIMNSPMAGPGPSSIRRDLRHDLHLYLGSPRITTIPKVDAALALGWRTPRACPSHLIAAATVAHKLRALDGKLTDGTTPELDCCKSRTRVVTLRARRTLVQGGASFSCRVVPCVDAMRRLMEKRVAARQPSVFACVCLGGNRNLRGRNASQNLTCQRARFFCAGGVCR